MVDRISSQPEWYALSHYDRYLKLAEVRRAWCERVVGENDDCRGRTVLLDGMWIDDVPGFYLALGEAINGPNGYFGAGLDALADCLCGGFGVLPPLTIRLSRFGDVRNALDAQAWCRFRAETFQACLAEGESVDSLIEMGYLGDGGPADIARWTDNYRAALAGDVFPCAEFGSYFDALLEVLKERAVRLIPDDEEASR